MMGKVKEMVEDALYLCIRAKDLDGIENALSDVVSELDMMFGGAEPDFIGMHKKLEGAYESIQKLRTK